MAIRPSHYAKLTKCAFGVLFIHGIGEMAFALSGWATTISSMPATMAYVFVTVAIALCFIGASGVYVIQKKNPDHIQIWTHLYGISSIFFLGLNAINIIIGLTHLNESIQACQNPFEMSPKLFGSVQLYNYPALQSNCQRNIPILIGVTAGANLISLIVLVIFGRFPQRYISELVYTSRVTMLSRSGSFAGPMTMARKISTRRAVSISSDETLKDKEQYYADEESGYYDDTYEKAAQDKGAFNSLKAHIPESAIGSSPYHKTSKAYGSDSAKSCYSRTSLLELYKTNDDISTPSPPRRQPTQLNVISKEDIIQNQAPFGRKASKDLPQIPKLQFSKLVIPSSPSSVYSASSYADTVLDNAETSKSVSDALTCRLARHPSKLQVKALERKSTSGAFRKNTLKREMSKRQARDSPSKISGPRPLTAEAIDHFRSSGLPQPPMLINSSRSILRQDIVSPKGETSSNKQKSKRKSKRTRIYGYDTVRSRGSLSSSYPSLRARFASPIELGSLGKRFRHVQV